MPQENTHKRTFLHLVLHATLLPLLAIPPNGELASRLLSFPNQKHWNLQFTWTPLWFYQPLVRFNLNKADLTPPPGVEGRNSLIWRRKSDDEYRWPEPISVLFERRTSLHSFKMTKLVEWIIFAGLAFSIWITLLTDFLPLKVSYKAKEVIWPVRVEMFDCTCGIKTIHRHSWN